MTRMLKPNIEDKLGNNKKNLPSIEEDTINMLKGLDLNSWNLASFPLYGKYTTYWTKPDDTLYAIGQVEKETLPTYKTTPDQIQPPIGNNCLIAFQEKFQVLELYNKEEIKDLFEKIQRHIIQNQPQQLDRQKEIQEIYNNL